MGRTLQMYNYFRPKSHQTIPRAKHAHTMNGNQESERKKDTSNTGIKKIANKWNLPWCLLSVIETDNLRWSYTIIQSDVMSINIINDTHFVKKMQADENTIWSAFT